ncbi:PepSY domain-containing protein [Neobacillus niacini]|uniref:PepSY domain-containing protein n=1 Tax=Neobacillus niacini TaxID=86668 RepID=UPI001C8DB2EC|nr:PepSY domain-containing protein [Neobacillus niacini]MBY0145000.1 PepSY domain-containing protein [Neobacillus niacini]
MKKKMMIGGLSVLLLFGGAAAVGASKSGTQPDDSIHADDKNTSTIVESQKLPEISAGQEIELETEHGKTFYKVETDDDSSNSSTQNANSTSISIDEASKIALNKVSGTITEVEKEMEHGRLEYKFEIHSNRGEADVRVDAETGKVTRVEFDDDDHDDFDDNDDDNDDGDGDDRDE